MFLLIAVTAVLGTGACQRNGDEGSRTRINVLDSAFTQSWQTMQDTGVVYRIEVISPLGTDTIRNVIPPAPVVVGDTLVIGLMQVSEDSSTPQRQIFRARLGQHRIETKPLPRIPGPTPLFATLRMVRSWSRAPVAEDATATRTSITRGGFRPTASRSPSRTRTRRAAGNASREKRQRRGSTSIHSPTSPTGIERPSAVYGTLYNRLQHLT
jgi:hypothetical protein